MAYDWDQLAHKQSLAERYLRDGDEEALDELVFLSEPGEIGDDPAEYARRLAVLPEVRVTPQRGAVIQASTPEGGQTWGQARAGHKAHIGADQGGFGESEESIALRGQGVGPFIDRADVGFGVELREEWFAKNPAIRVWFQGKDRWNERSNLDFLDILEDPKNRQDIRDYENEMAQYSDVQRARKEQERQSIRTLEMMEEETPVRDTSGTVIGVRAE